jgi:hypothetical protein
MNRIKIMQVARWPQRILDDFTWRLKPQLGRAVVQTG